MNYATGFAAGLACGMGCGIACGVASGRKKALEELRDHAQRRRIRIQDHTGREMTLDEFLEEGAATVSGKNRTAVFVGLGLLLAGVLAFLALFLYLR